MTLPQVASMIESIGVPSAYHHFTHTDVSPPFVLFYYDRSEDFTADNTNYLKVNSLTIELCIDERDFDLENRIGTILKENDLVYSKTETYLESERMYVVAFFTSVIITED